MLKGNVPILATAFTDDGDVDFTSIERLVKFLLIQRIDGLALFGNASEGYALTLDEKHAIFNCVQKCVGELPLVAAAGGASSAVAIEDINRVHQWGAQVAMVNPPSVVKPASDDIVNFYRDIGDNCSIDIMIQDAPLMTGVTIPVATLVKICRDVESVKYIKVEQPPTTLKITALKNELDESIGLFGGLNAGFLYEELRRGIIGTMPACEFPDVINKILDAWAQDPFEAKSIFYRYLPFLRYGVQPGIGVAIHKTVLHQAGIFSTHVVRSPAKGIDATTQDELEDLLQTLPLAVFGAH